MSSNPPAPSEAQDNSADAESAGTRESAAAVDLGKALDAARAEAAENLDKFLRAKAETDNLRRRAENDLANAHKFAIERFALEMTAVKDSLETARDLYGRMASPEGEKPGVDAQGDSGVLEKTQEGLDLTLKLMDTIFQKFAIVPVEPRKGDKFDPELHMAMSTLETSEVAPNHVLNAMQKGYLLHNRLLRPAVVVVGKAPAAGGGPGKNPDTPT